MKFGEKLLKARKALGLSRSDLARMADISVRTVAYYELENKLPKQRATVETLAKVLGTTPDELMDETADFVLSAREVYGAQGAREAEKLVGQIRSLYAGGALSESDMDAMMLAIQDAYWIAKKKRLAQKENPNND